MGTVLAAVNAVGCKVKLSFMVGAGKRRIDDLAPLLTPATKQCATVTPSMSFYTSSSSNPPPYPTPTATLINQGVTTPNAFHRTLVLRPKYKQLPPNDIVQVKAGNKLVVVIPDFNAINPHNDLGCVCCRISKNLRR
jgi:hypothetical protein